MKHSPQTKAIFPAFVIVFFISIFILFGIMEFRHTKNIIEEYEISIQQVALNKTNLFLENIKNVAISAAKKIENNNINDPLLLDKILSYDSRIANFHIVDSNGNIQKTTSEYNNDNYVSNLTKEAEKYPILLSNIHLESNSNYEVISTVIPVYKDNIINNFLVINFRVDQYQNEMIQEFMNTNYKIAVFDNQGYPVIWPFEKVQADTFDRQQENYYYFNTKYNISSSESDEKQWTIYFFFKGNNFELYRAITILLLVFALYITLYQFLVEFWGVNTAKTYFENIDFAIFNQIYEGVIIANNSGRIIFANEAAHNIFADRKNNLKNIKLKEILGNTANPQENSNKSLTLTLKFTDKILKAMHSPIIKNNKILGSLTVIRTNTGEENICSKVLDKLVETIPQGIIFVDKNHEVSLANLMAKCFIPNLVMGISIEVINRELADFIYNNIDSGVTKRKELSNGLYEITPVYDDDGIYIGTLVVFLNDTGIK